MSNTLVLFEAHRAAEEPSPPRHQDVETSTPIASPRAPSPKRPRIGLGESHDFLAGSSTTPPLDDVSILAAIFKDVNLIFYHLSSFSLLNQSLGFLLVASDEAFHQSWYPIYWVS
jgi:hypothetical protein